MRIVAFSGGKDSTAMLLHMLELGEKIDRIVFADTGFEFPELYDYIKRIQKVIGREIEVVKPESTFQSWMYGKATRGKHKGIARGMPLLAYPCYWTREAKVKPLEKLQEGASEVCIGIAYDEQQRMTKQKDTVIRYPLIEWGWTEADCVDYLNEKGLLNPLYVNFNRLGCWLCPKQGEGSLYVLWKQYPELWERFKALDRENLRLTGNYIKVRFSLQEMEDSFKKGHVVNTLPKYDCWNGCEGVKKAFRERQCSLLMK